MIRVNLLLVDRRARKKKKPPLAMPLIAVGIVAVAIVSLALAAYAYVYLNNKVERLTLEKSDKTARLTDLKKKIKDVEDLEKVTRTIEDKTKLIEELRASQSIPVRILDEVSRLLPENVWLTTMELSGASLAFSGVAFTNDDVVVYVNNLKGSRIFTDVYLKVTKSSTERGDTEIPVYIFDISMSVATVIDKEKETGKKG
ncbi:MAG: PilN domain-containing protein [Nitrospirae bacterium]|nr:PilN domain-containing protein [Nitrospirota bacterium]